MSEDWKTAVCVTAADYNGHDWDGSPFRYEGEFPHWLKGAMGSDIKPIGGERDYAVWAVLTDDYGQPRWIAQPGDWIVCIGGSLAVLSAPAYQAFRAGYLAQAETVKRLRQSLAASDRALAECRRSLIEQAMARADPTMPRLTPEVLASIRAGAEANYALAETRKDRINAHGLSLLCDWQERQTLADLQPKETK